MEEVTVESPCASQSWSEDREEVMLKGTFI